MFVAVRRNGLTVLFGIFIALISVGLTVGSIMRVCCGFIVFALIFVFS